MGLNGCGKTTLLKVITGLENPDSGIIRYYGRELPDMSFRDRSTVFAYVRQNYGSLSDYSVRDYLLFGTANKLDMFSIPDEDERMKVHDVVKKFGIEHLCDKKLGELSGGERQIVSICSAMVQDSQVIILDEPCSALDIVNQNKVLTTLNSIAHDSGKTIFFSTHNPNHALFTDANVFLLSSGRIIDSGIARDVITPDRLKVVYGEGICYSRDMTYNEISFRPT